MAFVRLALFPGGTRAQYERLARALSHVPPPPHRLLFAAGPVEDGWQVVQVWESRAQLDDFNRRWFLPAMASLSGDVFASPPVVTDFETADIDLSP